MAKPALGRGLGALLGANPAPPAPPVAAAASATPAPAPTEQGERIRQLPLSQIRPCPFQPRKQFSEESLRELADSIRVQGILQPLIVRAHSDHFELIAGERRWRAAQLAGLREVPAIVRQADDGAVLELALIENLQRENLNPLEEALGFGQLIEQFQLTQEEASAKVGKSRAAVANALRLLKLPPSVQDQIRSGRLSVGHAKVILGLNSAEQQARAAERVLRDGLNVRQTEELVAHLQQAPNTSATGAKTQPAKPRDAQIADLENRLKQRLGTKVGLRYRQGKGTVEIQFFSDAELERLLQLLGVELE